MPAHFKNEILSLWRYSAETLWPLRGMSNGSCDLDHEVEESRLVSEGMTQEAAHEQIMQTQPVGANYSPEVIKQYPEWFSPAYFDYWGISR